MRLLAFLPKFVIVAARIAPIRALPRKPWRLVPVIPFFIINLVMGLTPMRTRTYWWVTQAGMFVGILIYVNAGTQVAEVDDLNDILSPVLLGSLILLGVFPLLARKALELIRRRLENRQGGAGPAA